MKCLSIVALAFLCLLLFAHMAARQLATPPPDRQHLRLGASHNPSIGGHCDGGVVLLPPCGCPCTPPSVAAPTHAFDAACSVAAGLDIVTAASNKAWYCWRPHELCVSSLGVHGVVVLRSRPWLGLLIRSPACWSTCWGLMKVWRMGRGTPPWSPSLDACGWVSVSEGLAWSHGLPSTVWVLWMRVVGVMFVIFLLWWGEGDLLQWEGCGLVAGTKAVFWVLDHI